MNQPLAKFNVIFLSVEKMQNKCIFSGLASHIVVQIKIILAIP